MKLSTKGRYGVRFMLDLALQFKKGPATLKEISKRQDISEKYLWHLIPPLKAFGLITASRGPQGGYTLARHPRRINLLQIVSAVEGSMCLVECTEKPSVCKRSATCVSRDIWAETSRKIDKTLSSVTLNKMVARQKKRLSE